MQCNRWREMLLILVGAGILPTPFSDHRIKKGTNMAKNMNTFEKRRKEIEKKRKADEKRKRRRERGKGEDKAEESPALPGEGEQGEGEQGAAAESDVTLDPDVLPEATAQDDRG